MIKIENTETYGWEAAIRGMRNPLESWGKSDSKTCIATHCKECKFYGNGEMCEKFHVLDCIIGDADLTLMKKLVAAGTDHSKFMRMITVTTDIVAPLYWYKEFDTYKIGTVANSCSTMHKIHAKGFALEDFSYEHLWDTARMQLEDTIHVLNTFRDAFNHPNAEGQYKKDCWWQMIQLLPSSYNQRRTVMLNYAVLRNIYHARKSHKLDEWREFCEWIETLPYSEIITCETGKEG